MTEMVAARFNYVTAVGIIRAFGFFDDHLFTFKNLTKMNGKRKVSDKDTYVCLRH